MVTNKELAKIKINELMSLGGMSIDEAILQIENDVATTKSAFESFERDQLERIDDYTTVSDEVDAEERKNYTAAKINMNRAIAIKSGFAEVVNEYNNMWRVKEQEAIDAVESLKITARANGFQLPE